MSLYWSEPDSGTVHGIKDTSDLLFVETWCGRKLPKTRTHLHQNRGAGTACAACEANAMSQAHPLAAEFPLGAPVYKHGNTQMYVIGWLDNDPDSMWASPVRIDEDPDLAWALRAGVAAGHARFFKEHFTDREQ